MTPAGDRRRGRRGGVWAVALAALVALAAREGLPAKLGRRTTVRSVRAGTRPADAEPR